MPSSIVMFTFFCFKLEIHFFGKFGPKRLNGISKLKYGTLANSNVLNSMSNFVGVFWPEIPLWVQKLLTICLNWNVVPRLVYFYCFKAELSFLGKFSAEIQKELLKMNFAAMTNSNVMYSIVVLTLFFRPEWCFLGRSSSKIHKSLCKSKISTKTKSNILNLMVKFTFSFINSKYSFWANLSQKV